MIILLFGLPGSGKGTQGNILSQKLKIPHVSTGDILRSLADKDTEQGRLLKSCLAQGTLVPSDIINKAVKDFLVSKECDKGIIIDGYPRTVSQAEYLDSVARGTIKAIFFDVDENTILKRILGRFNCTKCNKIYNKYYNETKVSGVCDLCSSIDFDHRSDDNEEVIVNRIKVYKDFTLPVINHYKDLKALYTVNGKENIEKLASDLDNLLKMV